VTRVAHIIGNGDQAHLYNKEPKKGLKLTCNIAPFPVEGVYAFCIVDFKMMRSITVGEIDVPGEWILGYRPKIWMDQHPEFYMKRAHQIKEFFLDKPKYAPNYTAFNCGHMATYYAIKKFKADEIHMYGFDSIMDMNLRSSSDFYQVSPRDANANIKLNGNWRPIWQGIFNEFTNVKFFIHHVHNNIKFSTKDNVTIVVYPQK